MSRCFLFSFWHFVCLEWPSWFCAVMSLIWGKFSVIIVSNISSVLFLSLFYILYSHYVYVITSIVTLRFLHSVIFFLCPFFFALSPIFKSQFDDSNVMPSESGQVLALSLQTVFFAFPYVFWSLVEAQPWHCGRVSCGDFCLWGFAPLSCHSLHPPVRLSNFGSSGLPCDLSSLASLRRVVGLQCVQLFTCPWAGVTTSKLLTQWAGNHRALKSLDLHWPNYDGSWACFHVFLGITDIWFLLWTFPIHILH